MPSRILTVPNQLTFLRLAFLPFFVIAIHYERYNWALGILIVAGFTDALDGLLARGLNQKTPLGAYLDPIADKLLLSSSYLVLALHGRVLVAYDSGSRTRRFIARRQRGDYRYCRLHVAPAQHLRQGHYVLRNCDDLPGVGARAVEQPRAVGAKGDLRVLRCCLCLPVGLALQHRGVPATARGRIAQP